ncbi:hypothetical protein WEI85_12125 [Actinomycetes bacterium KLBMP 9797]
MAAAVTTVLLGAGTQAHAAPPSNVGWLYTQGRSGAVFFDADLNGYPSQEKITVCDNKTDGRGILGVALGRDGAGNPSRQTVRDPSNDGNCAANWGHFFREGYVVQVEVCEYWGDNEENCAWADGVS